MSDETELKPCPFCKGDGGLYTKRYAWLRENPSWETEAFLSSLSPEEFDAEVDKQRTESGAE